MRKSEGDGSVTCGLDELGRDESESVLAGVVGIAVQAARDVGHSGRPVVLGHSEEERPVDVRQVGQRRFHNQRTEPPLRCQDSDVNVVGRHIAGHGVQAPEVVADELDEKRVTVRRLGGSLAQLSGNRSASSHDWSGDGLRDIREGYAAKLIPVRPT